MMSLSRVLVIAFLGVVGTALWPTVAVTQVAGLHPTTVEVRPPDAGLARELLGVEEVVDLERLEGDVPVWEARNAEGALLGHIGSSWEIAGSTGYSGRPIDILVAVSPLARITGARLTFHNEPILTLGLTDEDIANFVASFDGLDLAAPDASATEAEALQLDVISRATVSTGVIRDAILRVGREIALARGSLDQGRIERVRFDPRTWQELVQMGAVASARMSMDDAAAALAGADVPVPGGAGPFLELYVALLDPPTIGRNILGEQGYTRTAGSAAAGQVALFVGSRGAQSHRGLDWRRSGTFDRIALVQDDVRVVPRAEDYTRIDRLAAADAPALKERSVFLLDSAAFDPTRPFRVEVTAERPSGTGSVATVVSAEYQLPEAFVRPLPPPPQPLWRLNWERRMPAVYSVAAILALLTLLFLFQESVVRRRKVWFGLRLAFLSVTLVWLGWGLNGQLSVVQVVAFVQSLLSGFRWETFLIEPVIFTLWSGVALGILFWGRGVYCGWLCPFGALQELTNVAARRLGVPQIAVPYQVHERLWIIKYTLFVAILALSFYSMHHALILAEAEPFKTAITLRMLRAWPFVLFVVVLLLAGLFIERFYCRYICPLGAALAIPAKLKIFDWLNRRPQCGRECRLCEQKCTVGAIDPLGRINPNECVMCLRCQVVFYDADTCPTLKRRARAAAGQNP